MSDRFDIVILGLTITSSWGNGHATTFRGLVRGLAAKGYRVLFLERDAEWYASNRDTPQPRGATTLLYNSFDELVARFEPAVTEAALVMVGSYVPDGVRIGEWVTAVATGPCIFYDIDTPVTLARLEAGDWEYITPDLIRKYNAYLSFTGGPTLRAIERKYGSPMARPLYCAVDPEEHLPAIANSKWDLGYLGTYSADRQPALEALLLDPARRSPERRFAVAGPQYPAAIEWPANVERTIHLSPREHPAFYGSQRFTLNITREAMKRAGYSPSVRLFEAGACGAAIVSDWWEGLDSILKIGEEVLLAEDADDMLRILRDFPEAERLQIGAAARSRVLAEHTPTVRAAQLESYWKEINDNVSPGAARRNGRNRQVAGGPETGLGLKRDGEAASGEAGATAVAVCNTGHLYEPARKDPGDSSNDCRAPRT
jgi:spore maturation protein CgeB